MHRFRILNRQQEVEAAPTQSLLQAADAAGLPWRRFCGASALCGTCAVIVVDGEAAEARPRECRERVAQAARGDSHGLAQRRVGSQVDREEGFRPQRERRAPARDA